MPDRTDLTEMSLTELAQWMAVGQPGSQRDHEVQAEFMRRQTQYQRDAAEAAQANAGSTARYTKYMLWSVIILAVSAVISMVLDALRVLRAN